jgi:C-terminal processing protease CtpA/Prc
VSTADAEAYIAAARDGLEKARSQTTAGWIVDLRGNGGGNLWPMLGALAPLLADGHVLSFAYVDHADEVTVDGGTVRLREAVQASAPTTFTTDLPVAVLIDGGTGARARRPRSASSASRERDCSGLRATGSARPTRRRRSTTAPS